MRQVASQSVVKITTNPDDNAAGEARKKRLVFDRLLSVFAIYFQGSAMAAKGERKDELCCSKLTCASLDRAVG